MSKFACMTAKCALFSYLLLSNLFPRAICNAAVKLHRFHINWILSSLTIRILLLDTLRGASRGSSPRAGLIESAASCTLCALLLSLQIIHRIRFPAVNGLPATGDWRGGGKWWRSLEGADFHSCAAAPSSRSDSCQTHFTLRLERKCRYDNKPRPLIGTVMTQAFWEMCFLAVFRQRLFFHCIFKKCFTFEKL